MKQLLLTSFIVSSLTLLADTAQKSPSCADTRIKNPLNTQTVSLNFLDEIQFLVPGCIKVSQGDKNEYRLEGDEAALREVKVTQQSGDLVVEPKGFQIGPLNLKPIVMHVVVKNLQVLKLSRSAKCELAQLKSPKLSLDLRGVSVVSGEVFVSDLVADVYGGAKVNLSGEAKNQVISIRGTGVYQAKNLESDKVEIDSKGSSSVFVFAKDKLIVSIKGRGSVSYKGDPKVLKQKVSRKGSLKKI